MADKEPITEKQIANRRAFVQISNRLKDVSGESRELWRLMNLSVGRTMVRFVDRDEPNLSAGLAVARYAETIMHIRDWLKASLVNDVPWLHNKNERGIPKKLAKCRTIEDLVREADKDMRKQNAAIARRPLVEGDERLEHECGDGWTVVRLLSPAALDRESVSMQHCIGNGAYDASLSDEGRSYLSLRDPSGNPHATIEIAHGKMIQLQGKQNKRPLEKYVSIALPYLQSIRVDCNAAKCGLVTDISGAIHPVGSLPEHLEIGETDLVLRATAGRPERLPKTIVTGGSLTIVGRFANPPESVLIGRNFRVLADNNPRDGVVIDVLEAFTPLPARITVQGSMSVSNLPIESLPANTRVGGTLEINNTHIKEIPACLKCGLIDLRETDVETFDTGHFIETRAECGGRSLFAGKSKLRQITGTPHFSSLQLYATPIKALPNGLKVEDDLSLDGTSVEALPEGLSVGTITAFGCPLSNIPDDIDVRKGLHLSESVLRWPTALRIAGSLFVTGGFGASPPARIEAEGLHLRGRGFDRLPGEIHVGYFDAKGSEVTRLEGRMRLVELEVSPDFEFLGPDVRVSGVIRVKSDDWMREAVVVTEEEARQSIAEHGRIGLVGHDGRISPRIEKRNLYYLPPSSGSLRRSG